jgi:hypothetical protein
LFAAAFRDGRSLDVDQVLVAAQQFVVTQPG